MKKVIHFRESDLLDLIKNNEITLPHYAVFNPNDDFIIDTETNTAYAVVVGVLKFNRYIIHIKEVQKKLFMPFVFLFFLGSFPQSI